jgi:hypothetical protein
LASYKRDRLVVINFNIEDMSQNLPREPKQFES